MPLKLQLASSPQVLFSHQPSVKIECCNIQGLRSNFSEVIARIELTSPALLFLTETQVSRFSPDLTAPNNYKLISSFARKHGVCVYIHPTLSFARAHKYEVNNKHLNSVMLRLSNDNNLVFVLGIYRSPNTPSSVDAFQTLGDSLCSLLTDNPEAQILIVGDFNIHNKAWLQHSSHTDVPGQMAELMAATFSLQQMVKEPTRIPRNGQFANTLDLVLSSIADDCSVEVLPPLGTSDHCLISVSAKIVPETISPPPPRSTYQYSKANWDKLNDFYKSYPWRLVLASNNVNDMVSSLTDAIKVGMQLCIPTIQLGQKTKKIFSAKVKMALSRKHAAYREYNMTRTRDSKDSPTVKLARDKLRLLSNQCKATINAENFKYYKEKTDKVLDHPNDPKFYYHTVRSLQNNFAKSTTPPFNNDGVLLSDPRVKCNHLASIFAANSTIPNPSFAPLPLPKSHHIMNPIIYHKNVVKRYLLELNPHKATGPDGIPALILKKYADIFAPILTKVFATSHQSGIYPQAWKVANVQPIPKKGDKADARNYRPIALISAMSKVFEQYINWHVLNHVEKSSILSDKQYGFREGRSTCDVLTMLSHEWNKALERMSEVYAISLDVAKAFDSVWHANLISKMQSYGFHGPIITLLESFLCKRKIVVVLDGYKSNTYELNAGVPQGSPLASTLFLIYINDLLDSTSNNLHSYADDTTLHAGLPIIETENLSKLQASRKIVIDSLTDDLNAITEWGKKNLMSFNSLKTQLCIISRKRSEILDSVIMDNISLQRHESLGLLGVTITNNLLWNDHIYNIAKNTAQKLGFLVRCRKFFTASQTLRIYKSMIRPCIEYCSPVWGGACETQLRFLDAVQRRAVRIINDPTVSDSLQSLQHRRDVADLSLFYRYHSGQCSDELRLLVPSQKAVRRMTRNSNSSHRYAVEERVCRTTHFQNDFFSRTANRWNQLPKDTFLCSGIDAFKRKINKYLLTNKIPRLSSHVR